MFNRSTTLANLSEYEMVEKQEKKKKKYVAPSLVQLGSFKKKTKASGNKLKESVFSNRYDLRFE